MKRFWGIRHIRWCIAAARYWHWWRDTGQYFGAFPNGLDLTYLDEIWDGKR